MKTLFVLLFFIIFFFFVVGVLNDRRKEDAKNAHDDWLDDIPHDHAISSFNLQNSLLIDESSETLIILKNLDEEEYEYEEIPYRKVMEVSLVENGQLIYAFPTNGVLGTAKSLIEEGIEDEDSYVEYLTLKILVDDLSHPLKEFICVEEDDYLPPDSDEYITAYDDCVDWYHKVVVLIKRSEKSKFDGRVRSG